MREFGREIIFKMDNSFDSQASTVLLPSDTSTDAYSTKEDERCLCDKCVSLNRNSSSDYSSSTSSSSSGSSDDSSSEDERIKPPPLRRRNAVIMN